MARFATVNAAGLVTGFYSDDYNTIPNDAVPLTDSQYEEWVANSDGLRWNGAGLEPYTPQPVPFPAELRTTLKSDVWRRCTDEEAETLDEQLAAQPVRLRRLWDDATVLEHSSAEFAQLRAAAVALWGAERADAILAPS